jgi:hypothetical protein
MGDVLEFSDDDADGGLFGVIGLSQRGAAKSGDPYNFALSSQKTGSSQPPPRRGTSRSSALEKAQALLSKGVLCRWSSTT